MSDDITFIDITREQFAMYVAIQRGGMTNMLDWRSVYALSDFELDKDVQKVIRDNYSALEGKYHV